MTGEEALRMTGEEALRMTGEEVLRMTGADRLSVLCHPEERQRRRICFRRPAGAEEKILRFAQDDKRGECSG